MKRLFLPLLLFIFLVFEGVAIELLPNNLVGDFLIIPHWVLILLIYITIFYDLEDTYHSVVYALIFGLLIDIVYTGTLGVYMFTYAIVTYVIHSLMKVLHSNFYVTVLAGIIGVALADLAIFVIYMVVGITDFAWSVYVGSRLIPTVLANIVFLLLLYPFIAKRLVNWKHEQLNGTT
ncbi:rod shape-determining protein MreD [Ornithinibacillus sp. L9]|uniref:Rod shape-determining protein MreD n=1 Tax=Ornithinibacillus caprae TaxID=2678566 RepID=A0A6N8FC93_9BACI|nr:rod shape-determining protein MreD [Ornithinibacillus caprae]MUK86975.1 rod shape-determining protein MreD [Ornithinibacillus caprae]